MVNCGIRASSNPQANKGFETPARPFPSLPFPFHYSLFDIHGRPRVRVTLQRLLIVLNPPEQIEKNIMSSRCYTAVKFQPVTDVLDHTEIRLFLTQY